MNNKKIITGLHILGNIYTNNTQSLKFFNIIKKDISKIIKEYKLKELGSFYYQFPKGGFTGVISLTESHIAIHTWPEFGYITLDVYLCDYSKNNKDICKKVFKKISKIFKPIKIIKTQIER